MFKRAIIVFLFCFGFAVNVSAQEKSGGESNPDSIADIKPWLVSFSANVGMWNTSDLDYDGNQAIGLTQVSYNGGNWGGSVTGIYARTSYEMTDNGKFDISTITDTDISTFYQYKKGKMTVRGGIDLRLPTGKAGYSETELTQMFTDDLSADLMSMNSYGGGMNYIPHLVVTYNMGRAIAGLGLRYEITGSYDSTTDVDDEKYDTGDTLMAVLNGAYLLSKTEYVMVTFTYMRAGTDKKGDEDVYRLGDTYSAELHYVTQWIENMNSTVSLRYATQGKNEQLGESNLLANEASNSNNNTYELFINNQYRYSQKLAITGLAGYKSVAANAYSSGDALYDAGRTKYYVEPGIAWYFSQTMYVTGKLRYSMVQDKADAVASKDSTYNVFSADLAAVYAF